MTMSRTIGLKKQSSFSGIYTQKDNVYLRDTVGNIDKYLFDSTSRMEIGGFIGFDGQLANIFVNPDQTKLYLLCSGTNTRTRSEIAQFNLDATSNHLTVDEYNLKSFPIVTQEATPNSVFFNDDGTIMYVLGNTSDAVRQYSLSTAWDVSTASYTNKSFSIVSQEGTSHSMYIEPTGSYLFVSGNNRIVYRYTISTPWDISTATTTGLQSYNVSGQVTSAGYGLFFKDDGTKMYVLNNGTSVFQYSLSTAWQLSSGVTYDSKFINVNTAAVDTAPNDIFFKSDGTIMYVISAQFDNIYQFSLSTAWDVSTASYTNKRVFMGQWDSNPTGVHMSSDGTSVYFIGTTRDTVFQLPLTTAWDLSTAKKAVPTLDLNSEETSALGMFFSPDGFNLYVLGVQNDTIYQYGLSTAWDVTTASYASKSFYIGSQETSPYGMFFKPDGTKFYVFGNTNDNIYQYTMSTPWEISTGSYDSVFMSIETFTSSNTIGGINFSTDGSILYLILSATFVQIRLSIPWNVGSQYVFDDTPVPEGSFPFPSTSSPLVSGEFSMYGLFFKDDGTKMYVCGSNTDRVHEIELTTPWNILTRVGGTYPSLLVSSQDPTPRGIYIKPDGTKLYVVGDSNNRIYQYSLSTPWVITSGTYDSISFPVSSQDATPLAVFFKPDGTKMYVLGSVSDTIYQYSLSTPWNISTASYDNKFFYTNNGNFNEAIPTGMFFKPDGSILYLVGNSTNGTMAFYLPIPWDISTIFYAANNPLSQNALRPDGFTYSPTAIFISNDGLNLYTASLNFSSVTQERLGRPWALGLYTRAQGNPAKKIDDQSQSIPRTLFSSASNGSSIFTASSNATFSTDMRTIWTYYNNTNQPTLLRYDYVE